MTKESFNEAEQKLLDSFKQYQVSISEPLASMVSDLGKARDRYNELVSGIMNLYDFRKKAIMKQLHICEDGAIEGERLYKRARGG